MTYSIYDIRDNEHKVHSGPYETEQEAHAAYQRLAYDIRKTDLRAMVHLMYEVASDD